MEKLADAGLISTRSPFLAQEWACFTAVFILLVNTCLGNFLSSLNTVLIAFQIFSPVVGKSITPFTLLFLITFARFKKSNPRSYPPNSKISKFPGKAVIAAIADSGIVDRLSL